MQLGSQLKSTARVVSFCNKIPGWIPSNTIESGKPGQPIYIYERSTCVSEVTIEI